MPDLCCITLCPQLSHDCAKPCLSRPGVTDWIPSLTSFFSYQYGPSWQLLGYVWPWFSLDLTLACGLPSQLELGPALLLAWCSVLLAESGVPCLPCSDSVGLGLGSEALPHQLCYYAWLLPSMEQPALAAPLLVSFTFKINQIFLLKYTACQN